MRLPSKVRMASSGFGLGRIPTMSEWSANKSLERTRIIVAAPCAHVCVRGPVRKCGRGRPFNGIVRHHRMSSRVATCCLVIAATCLIGKAFAAPPAICELGKKRGGLTLYAVEGEATATGDREIAADIDRDGIIDKIVWSASGSGSIIPADPSSISVTLSSTGTTLRLEEDRLHVVKYRSTYYAVTGRVETEHGPWHSDIYRIGPKAFTKACSFTGKGTRR